MSKNLQKVSFQIVVRDKQVVNRVDRKVVQKASEVVQNKPQVVQ